MAEAHCIGDGVVRIDLYSVKMTRLRWAIREETRPKKNGQLKENEIE